MDKNSRDKYLLEADKLLSEFNSFRGRNELPFYDAPGKELEYLASRSQSLICRAARGTSYEDKVEHIIRQETAPDIKAEYLMGIIQSFVFELRQGYLDSLAERIHEEMFTDFLDMASHLLEEGFKDAAAVIAGSSLESHLRQLCNKWDIDITWTDANAKVKPKKAGTMNADLAKKEVHSKADQKLITGWLDIRNNAAHGHYEEVQKEQVDFMIKWII